MRRDMDVVRQIVLAVRDADKPLFGLDGMPQEVFNEHVLMLTDAGLVDGAVQFGQQRKILHAVAWRLTWAGQEFASAVDDDTLWRKAKETVIKPAGSWTFDVLSSWLKAEISQGLPSLRELF